MSNPSALLGGHLASTKGLRPTPEWLASFLDSQRPTTPFQSLVQTASFRLLASDITKSLTQDACFLVDVADPRIQERRLPGRIPTQVLGVEDISKSRWEQIEAIEAIERGEGTRRREIIRVTEEEDGTNERHGPAKGGVHKLVLQDTSGKCIYALEQSSIEGVGLGMSIGCKILLQNAIVARGFVLIEPSTTRILGGKIDVLHNVWKNNRKADLKRGIEEQGS